MSIEERILRLSMDDGSFIDSADNVISKMDDLKSALSFDDVSASGAALAAFSGVSDTIGGVVGTATEGATAISNAFTDAWSAIYSGFMSTIGYNLANKITGIVNACTVAPVSDGWSKYEESLNSVQKMLVNTDLTIEQVEDRMNVLATYSDQTSYSYTGMSNALSTFIASGNEIDKSITAIIGLSNWAATAGVNAETAQGAYTMFSKAVSQGYMSLQQWSSLSNTYRMSTQTFYDKLQEVAIAQKMVKENTDGTLTSWNALKKEWDSGSYQNMDSLMYSTLKNQWLTTDLLFEVMDAYGSDSENIMKLISSGEVESVREAVDKLGISTESFGYNAMKSAQEAKTWTDVVNSWKDAVSTGWRTTFENIFGNYEESVDFWTDICDTMGAFFWDLPGSISEITKEWHGMDMVLNGEVFAAGYTNYEAFIDAIMNVCNALVDAKYMFEDAITDVFGSFDADTLGSITTKFAEFGYLLRYSWFSESNLGKIQSVIENLLSPLKVLLDLITGIVGVLTDTDTTWTDEWNKVHETFSWVEMLTPIFEKLFEYVTYVAEAIGKISFFFGETVDTNGETAIDHIVSAFKDLWEILKDIAGVLGDGLMSFLGIDSGYTSGNPVFDGLSSITGAAKELAYNVRHMKKPMELINEFLEPKADTLGLTKQMRDLNGEAVDLSEVIDSAGTSFEDVQGLFDDESWNLMQAVFGGSTPEEAWNNAMDQFDKASKDQAKRGIDLADRMFEGKTLGEAVEEYMSESDVDYFDLMVENLRDTVQNLPSITDIFQEVWKGFTTANDEYGFNLPTSWGELIDYVGGFVDKLQSLIDEKLSPLFDTIFGEDALPTTTGSSIFERIGELLAMFAGAYTNWNTDRWEDLGLILSSVGDIFAIVKEIVTSILDIATTGDMDATESTIIQTIDTVSNLISTIVQCVAVLIDSVGVAMGATDGDKVAKYSEDLGEFGTIATNLGTIIGNVFPKLLEILKSLWTFMGDAVGKLSETTDTEGFSNILTNLNSAITWVGDLVIALIDWVNGFLSSGFKETDLTNAGSVLSQVADFLSTILEPLKKLLTGVDFSGVNFDGLSTTFETDDGQMASLSDVIYNIAKVIVDIGVRLGGLLTEGAAQIACKAIEDVGSVVITFVKELKIIASIISGSGLVSFAGQFTAFFTAVKAMLTVNSITSLITNFSLIQRLKMTGEWLNLYANVLLKLGAFLLIFILAIIVVGHMLSNYTGEFIAGTIAVFTICLLLAWMIAKLYVVFETLTETKAYIGDKWYQQMLADVADSGRWFGIAAILMGLAAIFVIVVAALTVLTTVTSIAGSNGIKAMIASAFAVILVLGAVVGMALGIMYIIDKMKWNCMGSGNGALLAQFAAITVLILFIVAVATAITVIVTILAGLYTVIDMFSGGRAGTMLMMAIGTIVVIVGLIALLIVGLFAALKFMSSKKVSIDWTMLGQLVLIGALALALAFGVEALLIGVSVMMVALTAANDLKWETLEKGLAIILAIAAIMGLIVYAIYLISSNESLTKILSSNSLTGIKGLAVAAAIIIGAVLIFKRVVNALVTLSQLNMGNIDTGILWQIVAILGVIMLLAYAFIKVVTGIDQNGLQLTAVKSSTSVLIGTMVALLATFTALTWVVAKYGTDKVDTGALWQMIGVLAVIATIVVAIAMISNYFVGSDDIPKIIVLMGGIIILFGLIILAAAAMANIKDVDTEAVDTVMNMVQILIVVSSVAALIAMLISLIPGFGKLTVAIGALFAVVLGFSVLAFAVAIVLFANALNTLSKLDGNKLSENFQNIAQGLSAFFSSGGTWALIITSLVGGIAAVWAAGGEFISSMITFAGIVALIVAIIAAVVISSGGSVESLVDTIGTTISLIATSLPSWFDDILAAAGECMVSLASFIGTYSPMITSALVDGIITGLSQSKSIIKGGVSGAINSSMAEDNLSKLQEAVSTGKNNGRNQTDVADFAYQGYLEASDDYNVYAMEAQERQQFIQSEKFLETSREHAQELYSELVNGRILGWSENGKAVSGSLLYDDIVKFGYEGEMAWADFAAAMMRSEGYFTEACEATRHMNLDDFLNEEELAYFSTKYPELYAMVKDTLEKTDMETGHDADWWEKHYGGEAAEGITAGAEDLATSADTAAGILDGIGDKVFSNLDLSKYLGNWGSLFGGDTLSNLFGESGTIDASALINLTCGLNLTDENGNVLGSDSTAWLNQILGGSGNSLTGSDGAAVTDVSTLLNMVISGEQLSFDGQTIDIANGDLGTVLSEMLGSSMESGDTPVVLTNDVTLEGSAIFNTDDVLGDAETLATDGVSTYQATGEALGSALVNGFYSYYSAITSAASTMGWKVVATLRGFYSRVWSAGNYITQGFINGINSKASAVYTAAYKLGQKSAQGYEDGGGVESPSWKTFAAGVYMGEGAVNGMVSMTNAVYDAAHSLGTQSAQGYADGATVTPVIDTSAFQNGVGVINDTFAEASALNAQYTVDVRGKAKSTKAMLAEAFASLNDNLTGISGKMGFGEQIDRLGDRIGQMGFYVDGRKFANAMAEHNDTALAKSYVRRGRS